MQVQHIADAGGHAVKEEDEEDPAPVVRRKPNRNQVITEMLYNKQCSLQLNIAPKSDVQVGQSLN